MKNKIILLTFLSTFCLGSFAQNDLPATSPSKKYSFGIFLGAGFQNINGTDASGKKLYNALVPRFNMGVNEEIYLAPEFYLEVGIQWNTKGTKSHVDYYENQQARQITRELKFNYIEMPVNFLFKPLVGKGHLVLGFGPYAGYCIGGKAIYTDTSPTYDEKIIFGKDVPSNAENNLIYFKRLDMGANFLVGYELRNGFNIILNSQLGLININSNSNDELANKNTGFGLAFGYRF